MNASRVSPFRRYGFASRSNPSVVIGRALMPEPHIDPAPCAGCTSRPSGSGASFSCTLSYSLPASSRFTASPMRSGRPSDPTKRKSPDSITCGTFGARARS